MGVLGLGRFGGSCLGPLGMERREGTREAGEGPQCPATKQGRWPSVLGRVCDQVQGLPWHLAC